MKTCSVSTCLVTCCHTSCTGAGAGVEPPASAADELPHAVISTSFMPSSALMVGLPAAGEGRPGSSPTLALEAAESALVVAESAARVVVAEPAGAPRVARMWARWRLATAAAGPPACSLANRAVGRGGQGEAGGRSVREDREVEQGSSATSPPGMHSASPPRVATNKISRPAVPPSLYYPAPTLNESHFHAVQWQVR